MMQQHNTPQQDHMMSGQQQQLGQQMVLCPVRVVYETQILVPPGEQYQPNQTIFINPQNPPPWAHQNNQQPVVPQNQMLYVQQMPNNIAPSVQPIMEQNQMYIQQAFPNMQSVIQNQNIAMMQQNQERQILRQPIQTIQFPNVPPDINAINMNYAQMINTQNMNNIVHNIPNMQQTQILGQGMQNMQAMPQMIQQIPQMQQQRPMQQISQQINQQQMIRAPMPQTQQAQRPMAVQQTQIVRPPQQNVVNIQPNMTMNNIQNMQNTIQNVVNQQQIKPTVSHNIRPQNVQSVRHNLPQQVMMPKPQIMQTINQQNTQRNTQNYVQQNQIRTVPTSNTYMNQTVNTNNTMATNIPKSINNKIPIPNSTMSQVNTQLRARVQNPQAVRSNIPQLRPMPPNFIQTPPPNIVQTQSMGTQYIRPVQRFINPDANRPQTPQIVQTNQQHDYSKNNQALDNRKRKSESPDETKAKVTVNSSTQVSMPLMRNNSQFVNHMQKVGSLTAAPIQPNNSVNKPPMPRAVPMNQPAKIEPILNTAQIQNSAQIQTYNLPQTVLIPQNKAPKLPEQEKLIRNTVYAQARTRKLSNSQNGTELTNLETTNQESTINMINAVNQNVQTNIINIPSTSSQISINAPNMVVNTSHIPVNIANILSHTNTPNTSCHIANKPYQLHKAVTETPVKVKMEVTENISETKLLINESTDIKTFVIKKEADKIKVESNENVKEIIEVKKELKLNIIDEKIKNINSMCGKEIELSHGNKKSEKDNSFVLTHVLDGIVIQESNIAFPIRIPLKEKSILANPPAAVKDEVAKKETPIVAESKTEPRNGDNKIMTISKLNIEERDSEMAENQDNPFSALKTATVKNWTSEDLENHLSNSWSETASILREHEIDGEALFLVSSAQLLEIGINENHANILCEFVKS